MKGASVHIKNIKESNSSVIIRFKFWPWLSGYENVSGPSRNGPSPGLVALVLQKYQFNFQSRPEISFSLTALLDFTPGFTANVIRSIAGSSSSRTRIFCYSTSFYRVRLNGTCTILVLNKK